MASLRPNRTRSRRGVSVVVTTLMLIVATSMMGAFLTAWGNATFASQRLSISNQSVARLNQAQESFVIEDAWFFTNATGGFATVTIRNGGANSITVSTIAVNNTIMWKTGQAIPSSSFSSITFPLSWGSGKLQSLWVTTASGSQLKQDWKS